MTQEAADAKGHEPAAPSKRFLPVAAPYFAGNEKAYVEQCMDSTWISSRGEFIDRFEKAFAAFCQVEYALTCTSGTSALHLALLGAGVGPGDEVIVPTLTFVASANAVMYCGATPVFIDIEPETWNLDIDQLESKVTPKTKAIMAVHLFGHPVDMDPVMRVAGRYGLAVIEDAAEAIGAEYKGRRVGSIGHVATFSLYGNKIITTGEGGMITTNDAQMHRKMLQLRGQGQDFERRYWFPILGYNYRMTNLQAAIGLAQLEQIEWHIDRRRENARWYAEFLANAPQYTLQPEKPWAKNVYWINSVVIPPDFHLTRDQVMDALAQRGIETRPFFYPMHTLPIYTEISRFNTFPVADSYAARGINLPSSANLTRDDVAYVAEALIDLLP
jgi:perosamine synthetase